LQLGQVLFKRGNPFLFGPKAPLETAGSVLATATTTTTLAVMAAVAVMAPVSTVHVFTSFPRYVCRIYAHILIQLG
jgi:hypothetical protein